MKKAALSYLFFVIFITQKTQAQVKIYVSDISNFYVAFDSTQTTTDTLKQKEFLKKYYFDKASDGFKKFMVLDKEGLRDNDSTYLNSFINYIHKNKESLIQKRNWALSVLQQKPIIEKKLKLYKKLYPEFIDGDIIFVIGRGNIGGKPTGKDVLVGAEIIASEKPDWAVPMVLHEYTHTQQWFFKNLEKIFSQKPYKLSQILANAIWEGEADLIMELVYGMPIQKYNPLSQYVFGLAHEKEIWEKFKEEMFTPLQSDQKQWFMQQDKDFSGTKVKDIGYFMGHQICKKYYDNAKNKKKSIADMLNLKLDDDANAFQFLLDSGYPTTEEIKELIQRFKESKTNK